MRKKVHQKRLIMKFATVEMMSWPVNFSVKIEENVIQSKTATVENYAGDFFRLIESNPNTEFCDFCIGHFIRTAFNSHMKSNIHLAQRYKNCFKYYSP